jgi:hypothetical protein
VSVQETVTGLSAVGVERPTSLAHGSPDKEVQVALSCRTSSAV